MADQRELLDQLKIDRSDSEPSGFSAISLVVAMLVAGGVGAGITFWLSPLQPTPESSPASAPVVASTVTTAAPREADTSRVPADSDTESVEDKRVLDASGYVTARRMATVSSQITGLITEVNVEEGMLVKEGQVLARLDDALASVDFDLAVARLASQRATIGNIRANRAEAERAYNRAEQLRPKGLVSEAELTQATARFDALTADLERAQSDVAVLELEIDRQEERRAFHVVTAPFSGVVTVKNAQEGEIVSPSSAGGGFTRTGICTIVDMASLEVEVDVNEAFIGRVSPGQRVVAKLDAYPDWEIDASVIAIIPAADRAKAAVKVRIGFRELDARILPDMGIKVSFLSG
ncbi:MAG: efflux RND transporter periplasmic adaptor subunit [Pseudomonadota bacterium]